MLRVTKKTHYLADLQRTDIILATIPKGKDEEGYLTDLRFCCAYQEVTAQKPFEQSSRDRTDTSKRQQQSLVMWRCRRPATRDPDCARARRYSGAVDGSW